MHALSTAAALFSLNILTLTSSAVLPNIAARAPGAVLICTGENYTGTCTTVSVPFNECQTLIAPFFKDVGSFKPDTGTLCRITFTADTCTLHGDAFVDPAGAPTLHSYETVTGEVVDAGRGFTSFLCQECTGCV